MNDAIPSESNQPENDSVNRTAEQFVAISNMIANLPEEASVTREILHDLSVHVDEHGNLQIPRAEFEWEFLKAVVMLDVRVARLEATLKNLGNLPQDYTFPGEGKEWPSR